MTDDPRKAKTIGEAAQNPDGTYNGFKAFAWMTEALNPGKGLSVEEIKKLWEEVKAKKANEEGGKKNGKQGKGSGN
jgi:hypothetical protein